MEPPLAAVGSATVAVLSQSSGVAAIFGHEAGSRGLQQLRSLHVVVQTTVPWLLLLQKESSKREVCVPRTPSSYTLLVLKFKSQMEHGGGLQL